MDSKADEYISETTSTRLQEPRKDSPLSNAFIALEKSIGGLEMNIEALDGKLQPFQLRHDEAQRPEMTNSDRPPSSDFVSAILEIANRITRNAQRIRKINNDLEI